MLTARADTRGEVEMITDEQWNDINAVVGIDGVYFAPEMTCDRCDEMTDRNELTWVRVWGERTLREMWCNYCVYGGQRDGDFETETSVI
jgi:hypothetical protein